MPKNELDLSDAPALLTRIAEVGKKNPTPPRFADVEIFSNWCDEKGLKCDLLDKRDGSATRRELLTRFLLLNAVLDQGPDMVGVRELVVKVTNTLYRREVRFLHDPIAFFKEVGIAITSIKNTHDLVKQKRAEPWAKANNTNATKYNLFIDGTKQVLQYAIFRWGMPLAVPMLLMRHVEEKTKDDNERDRLMSTALLDYLEGYDSSEEMSQNLKDNEMYGLGKAIGDKAAHLFAKWIISSYKLTRRSDKSWNSFSFEIPFDSNLGRVLWRSGFLLACAKEKDYEKKEVIQRGGGKQGKHYIRVTNIRDMGLTRQVPYEWLRAYIELCTDILNHMQERHKR